MSEADSTEINFAKENRNSNAPECRALWDICTPELYRNNPFRIVGVHVDAGARDIKRRIGELRDALELGDASDEFGYSYALDPLPDLGLIQDASRQFDDPEIRVAYELFWFWPKEWGGGKADPAISALMTGDTNTALACWKEWAETGDEESRIVGRHNIAISYHLWVLDQENKDRELSADELDVLDKKWREGFEFWEELADSETFWSLVSARIRMLADPRLTTGFSRRMRATFPEAFDRINALLAARHIEASRYPRAELHIEYMELTHAELDDVPQTISDVAKPLKKQIRSAIERIDNQLSGRAKLSVQAILDLVSATERPRAILERLSRKLPDGDEDVGEFADHISEICRSAAIRIGNQDEDWDNCLLLIKHGIDLAHSSSQKKKCEEDKIIATERKENDHPIARQIAIILEEVDKDDNYIDRIVLLNHKAAPLLDSLGDQAGRRSKPYCHMRDEIAFALRECGIGLYNLNIKQLNEGFDKAVQMQNNGLPGARFLPVGRAAMVWLAAQLMDAEEALAVGDILRGKLKEDHEAFDSTREVIDSLVRKDVLDLSSKMNEWRSKGALPLPWVSIVEKGQPKPPPAPRSPSSTGGTSTSSGGCFIATAVYGSYEHPKVMVFREFRDRVLLPRHVGSVFVDLYYKVGPIVAPYVARSPMWKTIFRALLDRMAAGIEFRLKGNRREP